ncbi:HAD hydrolase-like protein [Fibrella aquatilis]|uniref:HAD hydrolase-like protein n=1 Tax=Fibrella aquatilis TaxID=2817059 RepID=A0A939K1Q9_9BACT|nr:HAD hydrolase-like protein [Fibrella aquatilis]MBO0932515.1 HAD hydrolase-like protein [Fibrella aquatilis]
MRYKLVIFDFDGTLADSFPLFLRAFNTVAVRYGIRPMEDAELDMLRTLGPRQLMQHLHIPAWKSPLLAFGMRRLMTQSIGEVCLFAGVPEMLRRLDEAGVRLALVSSNTETNVRRVLGPNIASLITDYVCGTALFGKARAFRKVLRRSGIEPAQTLAVGDELRDWEAAISEGVAFGAVSWGYTRFDALPSLPIGLDLKQMTDIEQLVLT